MAIHVALRPNFSWRDRFDARGGNVSDKGTHLEEVLERGTYCWC